ncbi:hypothetical protein, partial [Ventosimonas gracilis]|uniref:hypothetical protein n=1 Tax=Ventosimonas gracilis TaxID=1680762 RepID=UPI00195C0C9F
MSWLIQPPRASRKSGALYSRKAQVLPVVFPSLSVISNLSASVANELSGFTDRRGGGHETDA